MIDEDEDGTLLWFKKSESNTKSLSYVEYSTGDRVLYILDGPVGSHMGNPTQDELDGMLGWLRRDVQ